MFTANIYTPLDRSMVLLQFAARSFHTKKLCSRRYSIKLELCSQKRQIRFFEPPFGGVSGNVRTSSIARWKARGQLPIHYN